MQYSLRAPQTAEATYSNKSTYVPRIRRLILSNNLQVSHEGIPLCPQSLGHLVCLSERIKYVNWGDGVSWSVFIHQHFSSASRVEIMRKLKRRGCLTEECNCITNARPMPMALSVLKPYENSIIIDEPYPTILNKFLDKEANHDSC